MSVFEAMAGGASEPWLNRRDLSISTSNFDEPEPWSNRRSILVAVPVTCLVREPTMLDVNERKLYC
jgi:hypothetical protein